MYKVESKSIDRWLAVGLLFIIVSILCLGIWVPAISKWFALHEDKITLARQLKQYERILAGKGSVTEQMEGVKEQILEQGYFNSQQTEALASAELQELIKKSIVDVGGHLSSTQALPVNNKGKFSLITVSVRMTGNIEMLRGVLYRLETATPLIMINQLDIRPLRGIRNPRTRQIESSNELNINFQAVTFMRKRPG